MRAVLLADYAVSEGGAPQVAIASAIALARAGAEVTYIHGVGRADASLGAAGVKTVSLGGTDIWNKPMLSAARDGIWNSAAEKALCAILAAFSARDSVVHVHQWTKFFSPSVFNVIRAAGLPLVLSLHDYFACCPTGLMYRFDSAEPCALKPMSLPCVLAGCDPRSRAHKLIRVLRTAAAGSALGQGAFVALHVSEVGRRTLLPHLPASARQMVLENPVEVENHGPRAFAGQRKVAYCGRLTEEKGVLMLAEAARRAGLPSLFVGEGPAREKILAIDPAAEITGWLEKAEAARRLAAEALVLAAPSRWPETGPLVVAESMAAGVPVIVSSRAGAAGRAAGAGGLVVAPEVEALAEALAHVSAPGVAQAMGQAAHAAFWADPPTPDTHARKLLALYGTLLERTGKPAPRVVE